MSHDCVYSEEPPSSHALGERDDGESPGGGGGRGRSRQPMGSLSTLTGIFGLVAANAMIRILLGER